MFSMLCSRTKVHRHISVLLQAFEATEGYDIFEDRRRTKYNKNIATGVSMGDGLQEGVDRQLKSAAQ